MKCVFCGTPIDADKIAQHVPICDMAMVKGAGPSLLLAVIANLLGDIADKLGSINRRGEAAWFQDRRNER